MNQKPRTWHSLWDEMFSAFSVSGSSACGEAWSSDFSEAGDTCDELAVLELTASDADNDNAYSDKDNAARTQRCAPIDPDSLRDRNNPPD